MQRRFGGFLEQGGIDLGRDFALGFLEDVADPLVGGSERLRFRQGSEGTHGGEALANIGQLLWFLAQDGLNLLCAIALFAQIAGEPLVDEIGNGGFGRLEASNCRKGSARRRQKFVKRQCQTAFGQHADDAQRVAAQGEGVLVAGGYLADTEHADQGFQLVGERQHGTDAITR